MVFSNPPLNENTGQIAAFPYLSRLASYTHLYIALCPRLYFIAPPRRAPCPPIVLPVTTGTRDRHQRRWRRAPPKHGSLSFRPGARCAPPAPAALATS